MAKVKKTYAVFRSETAAKSWAKRNGLSFGTYVMEDEPDAAETVKHFRSTGSAVVFVQRFNHGAGAYVVYNH